jgi:hypothetical protein
MQLVKLTPIVVNVAFVCFVVVVDAFEFAVCVLLLLILQYAIVMQPYTAEEYLIILSIFYNDDYFEYFI